MEKLTYVKAVEVAIEAVEDVAVKEKLIDLRAALERRKTAKGQTKTQKANELVKDTIYEVLVDNKDNEKGLTVTEMLATKAFDATVTNQKLTALLRQMIEDGRVVKEVDKKKSYFKAVVVDETADAE